MQTVDVLVQVWDRGQERREIVPVEEECFATGCWRQIACIKAAVPLEMSFATLERNAHFGLRPEDKQRLFPATGIRQQATGDEDTAGGQ